MGNVRRRFGRGVGGAALAAGLLVSTTVGADDSCREWRVEHAQWKARALGRYLHGAAQRAVDAAVFEMLQRETYLTSCDLSVQGGRDALVGWRLLGRMPEDYGSAVAESVLESAGFDVGLRSMFAAPPPEEVATTPRRSRRRVPSR